MRIVDFLRGHSAQIGRACLLVVLSVLWMAQYTLWVPVVWACRLVVFATHSLGYLVLLLLFPFGWIILAILMTRRPAAVNHSYLRPWFRSSLSR